MRLGRYLILAAAIAALGLVVSSESRAGSKFHFGYSHHDSTSSYGGFGLRHGDGHRSFKHRYGHAPGHGYGRKFRHGRHYGHRRLHLFGLYLFGHGPRYDGYARRDHAAPRYEEPRAAPRRRASAARAAPYCREYTKTVIVGGVEQTAYGTACWQSDGSWKLVN